MRSVVAEECHWTILALTELLDWERLEQAREIDGRYHQAKLTSWAQWAPELLHEEHAEWRSALLSPTHQLSRDTLETRALALLRRSKGAH